jgi:MFS transporter, DHA1 family, tetracycline resistance protein
VFRSNRARLSFITLALTNFLDLLGFSIIIPILPPLFLEAGGGFFLPETSGMVRTIWLGFVLAIFGVVQFLASPFVGAAADHFGRRKVFLFTVANGVFGYLVIGAGIYYRSLTLLILGRIWTGFGTCNTALVRSSGADLTDIAHRAKLFGYLTGMGNVGFVVGPWIAGMLSSPHLLGGAMPFVIASGITAINFLLLYFFFAETRHHDEGEPKNLWQTFSDIHRVFHLRDVSIGLIGFFLTVVGWSFFLFFAPTYLVQRFQLGPKSIGDFVGYLGLLGILVSVVINPLISSRFSSRGLAIYATLTASVGFVLFLLAPWTWLYLLIAPLFSYGIFISTVHLSSVVSVLSPQKFQGRAMGVVGSAFSLSTVIAPLVAGPLAGLNLYLPLSVGAVCLLGATLAAHRLPSSQ